jgi:threonine aldolase
MRQAGILAAAGIYALKYNIQDLEKDHLKTSLLS